MSKIIEKSNFRVTIEPKRLGDYGSVRVSDSMVYKTKEERENAYHERCKEIAEQIKRHVDNIGCVSVDYDIEETCSHCNLRWESDELTGKPLCCGAAIEEFEQLQKHIIQL